MPKSPLDLLYHIRDECIFIQSVKPGVLDYEVLINDEVLKRALVRSLEIIGEASKKLGPDFQAQWPEVEWRQMGGMRDFLIHVYFGINYRIVLDVIENKIPNLLSTINIIISQEEAQ
ncbi:MAG: HepT-like ribonuclease domain-containing protein [Bacteroidia bacterium]|nr:HepT-like ribonuclease domain-containing protein [Bacteroidia bacterium]